MPPFEIENTVKGLDVAGHGQLLSAVLLRFTCALVLGALLAYRPWRRLMPQAPALHPEAAHTQILIAVAGAMMMAVIGDNMSRAFSLVGLGGFIRFRSGIKDPRDAAAMFVMIGVGMACGLGALPIAVCATLFFGCVLMALDAFSERRTEVLRLTLGLEDLGAALGPLRTLYPAARFLSLEQAPESRAGTAIIELVVPTPADGFTLLEGVRQRLPGVLEASIAPD
ncbi:DUF4956 domain-containing protein [Myxococcaceae bacterium GXIMD 01537]